MRADATAAVLLVAAASLTAQTGALTRADIEAAIAFGERSDPQPYQLRHAGRPENPVVVGAVYTPFLRVAFLSRAAAGRGDRLTPADVEARFTAPLVYIAFRWYCCAGADVDVAEAFAVAGPQVLMLPLAPRAPEHVRFTKDERQGAMRPVWSSKGTAAIEAFGATPPYDDIALVAAFPAGAFEARRPFAIFKEVRLSQEVGFSQRIITGVVRAEDAAGWR